MEVWRKRLDAIVSNRIFIAALQTTKRFVFGFLTAARGRRLHSAVVSVVVWQIERTHECS